MVRNRKIDDFFKECEQILADRVNLQPQTCRHLRSLGAIWSQQITTWVRADPTALQSVELLPDLPPWLVSLMLVTMKCLRASVDPSDPDHYLDAANYARIAYEERENAHAIKSAPRIESTC